MKVVKKLKNTVLLQNDDGFMFHVPTEVYEEGDETTYEENMIPYSLSFDLIIQGIIDTGGVAKELYQQGIHTQDDVRSHRQAVNNILKKYLSADKILNYLNK